MITPIVIKFKYYWPLLFIILNIISFPRVDILCFSLLALLEVKVFKVILLRLKIVIISSTYKSHKSKPLKIHPSSIGTTLGKTSSLPIMLMIWPCKFISINSNQAKTSMINSHNLMTLSKRLHLFQEGNFQKLIHLNRI